ncbi:hypothetical protein AAFF_G00356790 [Aldrovandia affinis]|uniref:Uncharacterized protein n=1 Tax=Aldrovandia affinis TaxID=143900 RepID=A0AAD7TA58_9TELE|nr:hypothetical protein AAFF_G00356790 [Aldrovandia affinis]
MQIKRRLSPLRSLKRNICCWAERSDARTRAPRARAAKTLRPDTEGIYKTQQERPLSAEKQGDIQLFSQRKACHRRFS